MTTEVLDADTASASGATVNGGVLTHPQSGPLAGQRYEAAPQQITPDDLLRYALSQNADLERLERFMALKQQWEANEARKAFVAAMTRFKAEPLEIFKRKAVGYETSDGGFVGYKYAELSDVTDVVVPAMARHGLSHRWDVKQEAGRVRVRCVVTHELGHSEFVELDAAPDASGKKNAIQQVASAITYLQRYSLLAIVGLATKGMDDDGASTGGEGADVAAEADALADQLIEKVRQITEDQEALDFWKKERVALVTSKPAYDKFTQAVVEHRKSLGGKQPKGANQ